MYLVRMLRNRYICSPFHVNGMETTGADWL